MLETGEKNLVQNQYLTLKSNEEDIKIHVSSNDHTYVYNQRDLRKVTQYTSSSQKVNEFRIDSDIIKLCQLNPRTLVFLTKQHEISCDAYEHAICFYDLDQKQ